MKTISLRLMISRADNLNRIRYFHELQASLHTAFKVREAFNSCEGMPLAEDSMDGLVQYLLKRSQVVKNVKNLSQLWAEYFHVLTYGSHVIREDRDTLMYIFEPESFDVVIERLEDTFAKWKS